MADDADDKNPHLADKHEPGIAGYDDPEKLAEAIGNARYDFVEDLFTHLRNKFLEDQEVDTEHARDDVAGHLYRAAIYLEPVIAELAELWDISAPHETPEKG